MSLPAITIPVEIPEAVLDFIPALIHPAIVHFAIVLPLVILFLELINLFMKRRSLTVSIYSLFVLVMIVFIAAYVTGGIDGKEAYPLMNEAGQAELKEHKLLGTYLVYLTLLPVLFKIFSVVIKKTWFRILYMVILAGFVALTFFQGKEGGELVYKHGANVALVSEAQEQAEDLGFEIEELQEKIEDLESALAESEKSLYEKSKEAVQKALESVTEPSAVSEEAMPVEPAPVHETVEHVSAQAVEETVEEHAVPSHTPPPVLDQHDPAAHAPVH